MKLRRRVFLAGTILLAAAQAGRGQNAGYWRVYKADEGMHQSACISVTVAPNGKVVALHRNRSFVTELDGYSVTSISLPEPAGDIAEGPSGQLWATVANGLLQEFKPGKWVVQPVPEIAAIANAAAPLNPTKWGQTVFLCADRLMEFQAVNPEHPQTQVLLRNDQTRLGTFTDLVAAHDGGLWITGERGLGRTPKLAGEARLESTWNDYLPPPSLQIHNLRAPREDEEGGVSVIADSTADGESIAVHFNGRDWTAQPAGREPLQRAWRSGDQARWVATLDSLLQQAPGRTNLAEYREISARQYYDVATEPGGTFWLATSSGLYRYAPPLWRNPLPQINSLVHGFAEDAAGRLWFVAAGRLHSLQGETHREFALPEPAAHPLPPIRSLFPLKNGMLLLDAGENSIRFDPESGA